MNTETKTTAREDAPELYRFYELHPCGGVQSVTAPWSAFLDQDRERRTLFRSLSFARLCTHQKPRVAPRTAAGVVRAEGGAQ